MRNSSDEEFNSDNEQIDLKPLWCNRPFLADSTSDEEPVDDLPDGDDLGSPRIELTPCTPIEPMEELGPLESLMAEIRDINNRVTSARTARQQLLDQGFVPRALADQPPIPPNSTWTRVGPNRYSLTYAEDQQPLIPSPPPMPFEEERVVPRRITQLRNAAAGGTPPPARWIPRWRQQQMLQMAGAVAEEMGLPEEPENPNKFVLPAALKEKEQEIVVDEATRAQRSVFISELIYSTLMDRRTSRSVTQKSSSSSTCSKTKQRPKSQDRKKY